MLLQQRNCQNETGRINSTPTLNIYVIRKKFLNFELWFFTLWIYRMRYTIYDIRYAINQLASYPVRCFASCFKKISFSTSISYFLTIYEIRYTIYELLFYPKAFFIFAKILFSPNFSKSSPLNFAYSNNKFLCLSFIFLGISITILMY